MLFTTNKEKGNSGLVAAIGYYGMLGYTISIPLNDTQDYDLVVDNGEKLLKIQVKATGARNAHGYTEVTVASCGGTKGTVYKTVKDTDIDYMFVLTEKQEMYEVPIQDISTTKSFTLGPDRQHYRVDTVDTFYFLKSTTKEIEQRKCKKCGTLISVKNSSGLCMSCAQLERNNSQKPDKETLEQELRASNFVAVGKKYGVSDNAVRKWCSSYGMSTHSADYKAVNETSKKIKPISKPVIQLDKETLKEIQLFNTAADASRALTGKPEGGTHISEVCTGKRQTAYGYKWKYEE